MARLLAGAVPGAPAPQDRAPAEAVQVHAARDPDTWLANKDLVELELRAYLNLRTYNSFEMLKYHERNNLEN